MTSGAPALGERRLSVSEIQAAILAARSLLDAPPPPAVEPSPPQRPRRKATRDVNELPAVPAEPPAMTVTGIPSLWSLLGVHGGSGATCLRAVLPSAAAADKVWPAAGPVVLVCRSTARGLAAAQQHARFHRDEALPVRLLGCIVVADAPGRLPPPLARMRRLLGGAVPAVWEAPWVPAWRLGAPNPALVLDWAVKLDAAITAAAAS